jgi:putative peptidoglycan lipid II flippase
VTTDAASPATTLPPPPPTARPGGRAALLVGAGILLSRVVGFVREYVFAHFLGATDAADAFRAALRIPNLLQNLFGEGVLSASFIPVYAGLLGRGDAREAGRVAATVGALLTLVTTLLVLAGMAATPLLIDLIAPGFEGEKRAQTIELVRILFPGTGLLVLSAWCLGILNSHRRFFLSYAAPVVWSGAMIVAMLWAGGGGYGLARVVAWAAVAGSALQLLVQLPTTLAVSRGARLRLARGEGGAGPVRQVFRNFGPVVLSRGVVQVSAYVDAMIASLLPTGALAALGYAQVLYVLPVSLFGMSISASELPELSRATGAGEGEGAASVLRSRLDAGLRRIALLVVPSVMGFAALGGVIVAMLYQSGRFSAADTHYVWGILAGAAVGLLAATMGRLYSSAFYALHDTRTPLRFALVRVTLSTGLGFAAALTLPDLLGFDRRWGAACITVASGLAGWVEFALLRRALNARVGRTGPPRALLVRLWTAAAAAAAVAWGVKLLLGEIAPELHRAIVGPLVLGPFGVTYFAAAAALGVPEAGAFVAAVLRKVGLGRLARRLHRAP